MATRKTKTTASPVKKEEKSFYAVIPEKYPLENDEDIRIFNSIERAFLIAQDDYDVDPTENKFFVYEIKKKGVVKLDINVQVL